METLRFFTHGPFCATDGERAWRTRFVRCDESAAALTYTYPTRQPARRPLTRPLLHPSIICAAPAFFLHESTAVPEPSPAPGDGANIAFARRTSTPGMCGMCISLSECSSLAPVPLRAIHAWSGLLQNSAGERSHERCISRTRGLRKLRPPLQPVERVVKSLARAH